jgi:hypothetical protein
VVADAFFQVVTIRANVDGLWEGYALVTDIKPLGAMLLANATAGVVAGVIAYARAGDVVVPSLVDYGTALMRFLP